MTHLDEKALSPCPFCASEASADGKVTYGKGHVSEQGWEQDTFYFCNCPTCGVSNVGIVGHRTQGDAIEAWNRRASPALPSSPVSDLVERLRSWDHCWPAPWLENAVSEAATALTSLSTRNAELEREVKRLREALEFYADTSKYPAPFTGGLGELYYDCGQIARSALSTSPQGGEHE